MFLQVLILFSRFLHQHFKNPKSTKKTSSPPSQQATNFQRYASLARGYDQNDLTLIFSVEGALLKSPSLFPYFMLVAFEGGSIIRAFVLLIFYPFICFLDYENSLKTMVFISFFGIKKVSFVVGRAVLPKSFLENVGLESFEGLRRGGNRVGVSDMPQVMIESFLRDYLEIECVVGSELRVCGGYFTGLMEKKKHSAFSEKLENEKSGKIIGIRSLKRSPNHPLFSYCNEMYMVSEAEKSNWHHLPKEKYPNPLIFHDGRLAFTPTPLTTLAMFMWVPFGFTLAIIRIIIGLSLPYNLLTPILAYTGLKLKVTNSNFISSKPNEKHTSKAKGHLYVCNHRTLLDPLYFSFGLKKAVTAVTYSLSRLSETLAPIRTVRLTRDRDQDAKMMDEMLNQGDIVVCPEGTTCRESYLLRFSPLFTELSDVIVPVAMDCEVSMFYGTTASGFKFLDPLFFLMNPNPGYTMKILDEVNGANVIDSCEKSRYDVANHVQSEIGKALGFECTKLTRKDKYLVLAGNEGIVSSNKRNKKM